MAVKMRVCQSAVGNHDPRWIVGSSPEHGINVRSGEEIVVTDELAEKFESSGFAMRVPDEPPSNVEVAVLASPETAVRQNPVARRRARA